MARGIAGHAAIEESLGEVVEYGEALEEAELLSVFSDQFDRLAVETETSHQERGATKDGGIRALQLWDRTVQPTIDPVLVEQNGQFVINDVYYDWTADLKDRDGKVRDWKFSGRKPSSGSEYVLNMTAYAIGLRQVTGEMEQGVQLDYLVCTQKPYHEPISGGPVPDEAIDEFGAIVRGVHDQIQAGYFPPSGLQGYGTCDWCGYSDGTCTAYRRKH